MTNRPRPDHLAAYAAVLAAVGLAALAPVSGCGRIENVHDSAEARGRTCVSCHQSAFNAASNPVHVGTMPDTCQDCHDTKAWVPPHLNRHPWYPVQNKHAVLDCKQCHTQGYVAGKTPRECEGCHRKDYDAAKEPVHTGFPTACTTCHNDLGWKPSIFVHPWTLTGKHITTPCSSCHTGSPPLYKGVPTDCAGCHQKDYDAAKNPPHTTMPKACQTCHTPDGWRPATFQHSWPLEGAHTAVACASCHKGTPPVYAGTPKDCFGCHSADFTGSPYPNHQTFPKTCLDCHSLKGWRPAIAGPHPEANFAITTGKHAKVGITCMSCHDPARGPSTGGQNTSCVACHLGNHTQPGIDGKHSGVSGYPPPPQAPNFCLSCHPQGTK
jgi:hypothetical protein